MENTCNSLGWTPIRLEYTLEMVEFNLQFAAAAADAVGS